VLTNYSNYINLLNHLVMANDFIIQHGDL
jgi:hypothetical protein